MLTILKVEPGKFPERIDIPGNLTSMQRVVGGNIQAIYPFQEPIALICHDEAKLIGLPLNRALRDEDGNIYDVIAGTFFLCGAPLEEENSVSLTEEQLSRFEVMYHTPVVFIRIDSQLICIPMMEPQPEAP